MTLLQAANIAAATEPIELFLARVCGDEDLFLPADWDAVNAHLREIYRLVRLPMVEIRAMAGLTQAGMHEKLGIPKRTIENWEGGKSDPPVYEKCMILLALGFLDPPYEIPEPEEEEDDYLEFLRESGGGAAR